MHDIAQNLKFHRQLKQNHAHFTASSIAIGRSTLQHR